MKRGFILFISIFLLLFAVEGVYAEVYTSISGKVIAEDTGEGIGNVNILIHKCPTGRKCRAISNDDGTYVVEDLPPGDYYIDFDPNESNYLHKKVPVKVTLHKGKHLTKVEKGTVLIV